MNNPRRLILISLLFLSGFILLSSLVLHDLTQLRAGDHLVYEFSRTLSTSWWLQLNTVLSFIGQGYFLFPLAGLVMIFLFSRGWVKEGIWYILSLIIGMQANASLKMFFGKTRPHFFDPTETISSFSFPSGHAFGAVAFYLLTTWFLSQVDPRFGQKKIRYLAAFLALAIGFSRIFLGVHWASDVLGGFLWGLFWVCLNLFIAGKFQFFRVLPHEKV